MNKEKIKIWLKDRTNLIFLAILIFAIILHLYYFSLTNNQPLWWDEAEYGLRAKNIALGTPDTGWWSARPFLFPYIMSIFYFLGLGELSIRFFIMLFAILNICLVFILGKDLINKKAALVGAFLMGVFYLNIFYSNRILINIVELSIGLIIFTLFYSGYIKRKNENCLLPLFPLAIVGFGIRFTVLIYLGVVLVFLFVTKGINAFKIRKLNYSFLIALAIAIPALIFLIIKGVNPISSFLYAIKGTTPYSGLYKIPGLIMSYLNLIYTSFSWYLFIPLIIGALVSLKFFLVLDKILFKNLSAYQDKIFIFIWFLITFLFYGGIIDLFDDRYFMMAFPCLFLICGIGLEEIFSYIKKNSRYIAILAIILLLAIGGYMMLVHSNQIVQVKLYSYDSLKEAGTWIKDNSALGDNIITSATPEITYYSERATFHYPDNESDFYKFLGEKKPKYIIVTVWERSPEWAYRWVQNSSDIVPVRAFYSHDFPADQPTTVIYQPKNPY